MKIRNSIILAVFCFYLGTYINDDGLKPGNILLTNLRAQNGVTVADIVLIGERNPLKRELTTIHKDYPLYDEGGNMLLRMIKSANQSK